VILIISGAILSKKSCNIILYCDLYCFFVIFMLVLLKNHTIMQLIEIGQTIKERRKNLKITQPDLAEMAGISLNTVYKIERGKANPTINVLNKLASVLGLELKLEVKQIKL